MGGDMSVWMSIGVGLALLVIGGEVLVRGASSAARRLGVSPLVIGLTLVGFGTSTPELVTSLQAAFAGSPGIAIGNVVGSNISNALLILGVTALIAPVAVDRRAFFRDGPVLAIVTGAAVWALFQGELTRRMGAVAVGVLLVYVLVVWLLERRRPAPEGERIEDEAKLRSGLRASPWLGLALAVAGIGVTVYGAGLLVGGAVNLARSMGVSDTVVGLTIVAVGTSLPEVATSIMAALRGERDIAVGNIVGSNVFNVLLILGAAAILNPVEAPLASIVVDVGALGVLTLIAAVSLRTARKLSRLEGALLLLSYAVFLGLLVFGVGAG